MCEKRFTTTIPNALTKVYDDGCVLTNREVVKYINWYRDEMRRLSVENEKLKQENEQLKSTITHLQEECGARENDYVNLKNQLDKIPPRIKEIWLNG